MSSKSSVNIIEASHVHVAYGAENILQGISFTVKRGEVVAIIGPNGSGKTTLIKALIGLLPMQGGNVKILNQHPHEVFADIGYLPQQFSFDRTFPITVAEFLRLSLGQGQGDESIEEKLAEVGMLEKRESLLGTLSGGQLQRVLIARALLNNPRLLILDEPATGVDVGAEKNFYQLISHLNKKHDITVLFISHELELVYDFADQVICLNKTMVCRGTPRKVLTAEKLEELYGGGLSHHHHWVEEKEAGATHRMKKKTHRHTKRKS